MFLISGLITLETLENLHGFVGSSQFSTLKLISSDKQCIYVELYKFSSLQMTNLYLILLASSKTANTMEDLFDLIEAA